MAAQKTALQLVAGYHYTGKILVDGGFAENPLFMQILASELPGGRIYAATVPQSTASGAALAIHSSWNTKQKPAKLISLKQYGV